MEDFLVFEGRRLKEELADMLGNRGLIVLRGRNHVFKNHPQVVNDSVVSL